MIMAFNESLSKKFKVSRTRMIDQGEFDRGENGGGKRAINVKAGYYAKHVKHKVRGVKRCRPCRACNGGLVESNKQAAC